MLSALELFEEDEQMRPKRRNHAPAFKAKVALAALKNGATLNIPSP